MSRYTEHAEKATPLPWSLEMDERRVEVLANGGIVMVFRDASQEIAANAALIVALVNAAPDIERLWEAADLSFDDDPCSYDHHGYCQTHGCGDMGDRDTPHCPTDVGRAAVNALRALFGEEQK